MASYVQSKIAKVSAFWDLKGCNDFKQKLYWLLLSQVHYRS